MKTDGSWEVPGARVVEFLDPLQLADADRLVLGLPPLDADGRFALRVQHLDRLPAGTVNRLPAESQRALAQGKRVRAPRG